MILQNKKALLKSFILSFFYVGISTLSLISMSPLSGIYSEWASLGLLITILISTIGFCVMYMERDYQVLAYIQVSIFFLIWLFGYKSLLKYQRSK